LSEIVRKIHADLLAKIQAEPEKKYQVLIRLDESWFQEVGKWLPDEALVNIIKGAFGVWNRRFGNVVFIEFVKAWNLRLNYLVFEIKGMLIPLLEKLPQVEWISEQKTYHAIDLYLAEEGVPGAFLQGLPESYFPTPLVHETLPYLGFDKIHKDQKFIDKGLGKDGKPAGVADTGISMSTGEKWSWLYEKPEGPDRGRYRVLEGKDFSGSPRGHMDGVGHGSHIANIIASAGKKYLGCVPQGPLYSAKVLNDMGWGYTSWIIKGIDWLVGKGCVVINLSLGSNENTDGTDELSVACDRAWDRDVYVCIAIGNNGTKNRPYCDGTIGTPACSKKCAVTGATSGVKSQPEQTQYFSSRPPTKDGRKFELKYVVAPGLKIAGYDSRMNEKSGSSFAAPWHSALAWILRIVHPDWTNEQVWQAIKNTAVPLGYKDAYGKEEGFCLEGYGRIDAWAAYNYGGEVPPIPEPKPVVKMVITIIADGRRTSITESGREIKVEQEIVSQ